MREGEQLPKYDTSSGGERGEEKGGDLPEKIRENVSEYLKRVEEEVLEIKNKSFPFEWLKTVTLCILSCILSVTLIERKRNLHFDFETLLTELMIGMVLYLGFDISSFIAREKGMKKFIERMRERIEDLLKKISPLLRGEAEKRGDGGA